MKPATIRLSAAAAILTLIVTAAPLFAEAPAANDVTARFAAAGVSMDSFRAVEVGGIVVLRGRATERAAAENAATVAQTLGYSRVANLITVTEAPDDAAIARAAERELSVHRGLDGTQIAVGSSHGVVRLTGHVAYELQKDMAVRLVRNVDGVRGVESTLDNAQQPR